MPMDNNDNNYPELSEENSKITSVLHPYGLPKFDFDHTHIRFDSLSENEDFLGISSREDDNWIEDFSRGNSGIEFGSSAADCSLPRHVDVWSEATSSESVEMLLKSVGQEEILQGESIIDDPNAFDELGTLAKQMELNPRPDGNRNGQESNPEAPKVQPLDNCSGPNHGSEDVDIEFKCSSVTQVEYSASGCSVTMESGLVVHEWNSQDKESCVDGNQPNPGTSLNESLNNNMEGTFVHGIHICSDTSQHVMEDVELSNGQGRSSSKPLKNTSNEPTQRDACNVNDSSVCRTHDAITTSMTEFSVFASLDADATRNFDQLSGIKEKEEISLPTTKGNSQDLHSFDYFQNSEDLVRSESLEIKHSTDRCEKSFGGSEGDLRVKESSLSTEGNSQDLHSYKSCQNSEDSAPPESLEIQHSTDICETPFGGPKGDPRVEESSLPTTKGNNQDLHSFESCQNPEDLALPESLEIKHSTDIREKSFDGSEGDPRVGSSVPTTKGNNQDVQSIESCQNLEDFALPESLVIKHSTDICEKSFGGSEGDPSVNKSSFPTKGNRQDLHSVESCQNPEDLALPESLEIKHSMDICDKSFGGSEGDPRVKESSLPTTKGRSQDLHSYESCQNSEDFAPPESLEVKHSTDICEKSFGGSEGDTRVKESSLPTTKGNNQDLHSFESCRNAEDLALPEEIKHSTDICEKSFGGSTGEIRVNEKAASSTGVDIECEQLDNILPQTSHTECSVASEEISQGCQSQLENEEFTITSNKQIPGMEPEHRIQIIEDPMNHADNLPVLAVAAQSAQSVAENIAQDLKELDSAAENHEDTVISSTSSGMSVEAANLGNQDPADMNYKPAILYNDVARVSTLSLDEEAERTIDLTGTLESDEPSISESNVASNVSNAASHERSRVTTDDITEQHEELNLPSDAEPIGTDKVADKVADVVLEEEIPSLKFPSQIKSETGTVSFAGNHLVSKLMVEKIGQDGSSLSLTETRDVASLNEGVTVHQKEALGFSLSINVDSVPCDSNVVAADAVCSVKHLETKLENSLQAELSEVSGGGCFAEADKVSRNNASVISCIKLPEPDGIMKEDHIEPATETISGSTSKASEVSLVPKGDGANEGSRDEQSFSFDIPPVAAQDHGSMPSSIQKNDGGNEVPQVASIVAEGRGASIGAKTTSGSKTRHGPAKSTRRKAKNGDIVSQPEDNSTCGLVIQPGPARLLQFGIGITDSSGRKSTSNPIPASNLPDLNTSMPTSPLFHQPFTDLQQVQLRAQIFVYGSLIQGTAPEEACMVSAFGTSALSTDGGRTSWEPKWRAYVEQLQSQKTADNYSTPIQSRSGSKGKDKLSKQSAPRSKAAPSPVNLFGNKGTPLLNVKPIIPLSSPLWNLSTPLGDGLPPSKAMRGGPPALPPLHPCQTPIAQTFGGQSTSRLSPPPIPGTWVSSSRCSALDLSARISSSLSADVLKFTPLSDSSLAVTSSMKDSFNDHISHGGVSGVLVEDPSIQKTASFSASSKSRKRRKSNTTEESPQDANMLKFTPLSDSSLAITSSMENSINDHGGVSTDLVQDPSIQKTISSPSGSKFRKRIKVNTTEESPRGSIPTTSDLPDSDAVTASQVVAVDPTQRREELHMEKNFTPRGEIRQVEKAKLASEEAAAHAAELVSHCKSIWSALEKQRNSSIAPDCELQLSSSAAAVTAAASVAKAAAAAAKLASTAALHFHQAAIQLLHGNAIPAQETEYSMSDVANNLSEATPASILRGGNLNDPPNSIISAARVAARRRVEAALADSQHAENLDAIVKAAELAAEAVSQAGKVVALGKPMPSSDLDEAVPEKCITEKGDEKDIGSSKEASKQYQEPSDLEMATMVKGKSLQKDIMRDVSKNIVVDEPVSASQISGGTKNSHPDHTVSGSLASNHNDAESVPPQDAHGCGQKTSSDDKIKENCTVEVFKAGGCFKGGWYSAKVLSLNDEKALVCFTDLQYDKDSDSPREWIPLEREGNEVPNIRVTHQSGMHFDGPRKRSRAAATEYQWSVGDRVDAWSKDCWREGVITEQNNNDQTTFTVHFPAHGETAFIKAWHLRPTLTWKNGKWIGLLTSRPSSQGDTPRAKRLRQGSTLEVKGKGELPKTVDNPQSGNVDKTKLLPLSSTEKVFNIGNSSGDNKVEAPRMMRSGLQKEGLKIFGVPRPGKKRKFMDVSKHMVSERNTKNDVPNDSSKLSKYLMHQGAGSRGIKNDRRVDVKEKQFPESKLKAPNASKFPGISSRTLSQKENSTSAVSGPSEIASRSTVKGSNGNNERGSSYLFRSSSGSNHEAAISVPVSTQSLPHDRNKKASKNINSERIMKGKLALASGKAEAPTEDKLLPDSTGPRRSNRKIQPTSRLLEGLQTSFVTSKIPLYSHDRNNRLQSKGASTGANKYH